MTISNITISDYSEKSFVVRGNTEQHKEALKDLGGKWNARLRDGEGWIFPSMKKDEVQNWQRTGVAPAAGSRQSFYQDNTQQSSSLSNDRIIYAELKKMSSKIDRLEKLILTLSQALIEDETVEQGALLVLANSSDEEEVQVPIKRLLGGR